MIKCMNSRCDDTECWYCNKSTASKCSEYKPFECSNKSDEACLDVMMISKRLLTDKLVLFISQFEDSVVGEVERLWWNNALNDLSAHISLGEFNDYLEGNCGKETFDEC